MPSEMASEAVEIVTMAMDKFQSNKNYEVRQTWNPIHLDRVKYD